MTFHKYKKIRILGHDENADLLANSDDEILVTEKVDGGNARFFFKDGRIIFGSRTQSIGDSKTEIGGNWKRWTEFIKDKLKDKDLRPYVQLIFYGEACLKHTMDYDWEKIPPFLGFDVLNIATGEFIPYPKVKKMFTELGLPFVPVIWIGKVKELPKFLKRCEKENE